MFHTESYGSSMIICDVGMYLYEFSSEILLMNHLFMMNDDDNYRAELTNTQCM